jgi:hypothetical protein
MSRNFLRVIACLDFVLAAVLTAWGVFLATSPLHPVPGDSHGGLMAVFPGLLLILLAVLLYCSGKALLQKRTWGLLLQTLVVVPLALLGVLLST